VNPLDTKPGLLDISWRMFGTPVRVKIWFWLFMALFGWLMGLVEKDGWEFLLVWVACGFISVMVHELGHIIAGRCFGIPGVIILNSMGGGAVGEYARAERWQRIVIAASGPAAGFLFYALFYVLAHPIVSNLASLRQWEPHAFAALSYFAYMNLFWNILNLPPILPMDGGMIMKDLIGYVVGARDFVVGSAISVLVAGGIAGYSLYKIWHPNAPFLGGLFRSLYPYDLRLHSLANMDPDPTFMIIIYGLLAFTNLMAMFRRPAS
jgi:stage IV sporulation protein FB